MSAMRPVAIAVAPNGARRTTADHARLPMTAADLARTAAEVADAGAAMMHVHVRDRDGNHSLDADLYRDAIAAIRAAVGDALVIQITTEAAGRFLPGVQMAVAEAVKPEAVSLALRELCLDEKDEASFAAFLARLRKRDVAAQFILYEPAEATRLIDLAGRGVVPDASPSVLYVLGRYLTDRLSAPEDVSPFLDAAGERLPNFMVCAFGQNEAACGLEAARRGGDVRVGFENNLHLPDGTIAPDNAALVRAVAEPLAAMGRRTMRADELRALLHADK